ncbi:MAG TPA: DUF2232 domain-containing protein [Acidimicrobiales bacterium]|jgi:energy-coupling factor transport system ATP-binding protein|nr:DUF2232 domain-containing protein [Acidimicrobiales bacterium]
MAGGDRRREGLTAAAIAEAAVLIDVTVALCLVGWVVPYGTVLLAAAVVPMAALGDRRGWRTTVLAGAIGGAVSFVVMGSGPASNVIGCAVVGGLVGAGFRRRWSLARTTLVGAVTIGPLFTAGVVGFLAVFASLRRLVFKNIRITWHGVSKTLEQLHLHGVASGGDRTIEWITTHWLVVVPPVLLVSTAVTVWLAAATSRPVLVRLTRALPPHDDWLSVANAADEAGVGDDGERHGRGRGARAGSAAPSSGATPEPVPVPVAFHDVTFRYPGASIDALAGVSLAVEPHEVVAVVGPNGSGKSTLARLLCGAPPSSGRVDRAGPVGVGRQGGTAIIFQRPECQVLGVRVRDDVVWGLPPDHDVAVAPLLQRVGLGGMGDRETTTLSGGELQRLAVAAGLARSPQLLISDESTSMIDPEGRPLLIDLFAGLAEREGITVVHITHHVAEAQRADRVLALEHGRVVAAPAAVATPVGPPPPVEPGPVLVSLHGVRHTFSPGTPWAHVALDGVDLKIRAGEAVLMMGHNGSGKSTLAWLIAGLLVPTEGSVVVEGRAAWEMVGHVGLSFQHARLQLLRSTVIDEVRSAGGVGADEALAALALVGLGAGLADRRIDQLSGGQQRRVVLAGLLAAKPAVLVLDEPFAGLDEPSRRGLLQLLAELRATAGITLIVVTHDPTDADLLADRVVTFADGRVVDDRAHEPLGRGGEGSDGGVVDDRAHEPLGRGGEGSDGGVVDARAHEPLGRGGEGSTR